MPHARNKPDRISAISDGIFAVLITVLVLELRPPEAPTFKALVSLWPTWLSYAVSYLFIAIVWANHHHLLRYATETTPHLMWFNFAHLFSVSLLPLATAWMAVSRLAAQPVAFYAAVFFLVNLTYICLIHELIDPERVSDVSRREGRMMRIRSIVTLCVFGAAAVVALMLPSVGLGMCVCCLIVYLRPQAPGVNVVRTSRSMLQRRTAELSTYARRMLGTAVRAKECSLVRRRSSVALLRMHDDINQSKTSNKASNISPNTKVGELLIA